MAMFGLTLSAGLAALAIMLAGAQAQSLPGQSVSDHADPAPAIVAAAPAPAAPNPMSILGTTPGPGPKQPPTETPGSEPPGSEPPGTAAPAAESDDSKAHEDDPSGLSQTIDVPVRPALAFSAKADWDEGYAAISAAVARLRREVARLGLETGGPPLVVYLDSDDAGFQFDALLPLAREPTTDIAPDEGVRLARNPGGRAIKFEHRGPYSQIEFTYQAITVYLDQHDLHAQEFFIEEFADEPGAGSDAGAMGDPENPRLTVNIYVFLK